MINIKPIPALGTGLIDNLCEISPNNKYIACVTKTFLKTKTIQIFDIDKNRYLDHLNIYAYDSRYEFSNNIYSKIKIHDITFNDKGSELFCVVEKKHATKLYQFTVDSQGLLNSCKPKKILSPFKAQQYVLGRINNGVLIAGFTNNTIHSAKLTADSNGFKVSYLTSFHFKTKIANIKLDKNNLNLGVLLDNRKVHVLTRYDDSWCKNHTYRNCINTPIFSNDGKTLIFQNQNSLELKSLNFPETLKYRLPDVSKINDVCINSADNKITVFYSTATTSYYSSLTKQDNKWSSLSNKKEFQIFVDPISMPKYRYRNLVARFNTDDSIVVLFNANDIICYSHSNHTEIETTVDVEKRNAKYRSRHTYTTNTNTNTSFSSNNYHIRSTQIAAAGGVAASCSMGGGGGC